MFKFRRLMPITPFDTSQQRLLHTDNPARLRQRVSHTRRIIGAWLFALSAFIATGNVALAETCVQATPGTYQWQSFGFEPQSDMFTYYIHAMPQQAKTDTLVGLSQGPATHWNDIAAIVRFNPDGYVDVRDGDVYIARTPVTYGYYTFSGDFRLQVDMRRKTYSVWYWSTDGDSWILLAKDARFRTQQVGVTQLDHFTAEAETGGLGACARDPDPFARVGQDAPQWSNAPLEQTPYARYIFYVRPDAADMDGLVALSKGAQTHWSNLAAIVRFNSNNMVDVRNGGAYQADAAFNYVPGETYQIVVYVDWSTDAGIPHNYSVWIAPVGGGASVRIANEYLFRTEQQGVTDFDNWVAEAELGGLTAYLAPNRFGY